MELTANGYGEGSGEGSGDGEGKTQTPVEHANAEAATREWRDVAILAASRIKHSHSNKRVKAEPKLGGDEG